MPDQLDEQPLGNLPMALQVKLLRVPEARELQPVGAPPRDAMDVRFVAATQKPFTPLSLARMVRQALDRL